MECWRVTRDWDGASCAIVAGGPSVTPAQVEAVRGLPTIAVNDAYRLAPWADVLYGCDGRWWDIHEGVPGFSGIKATQHEEAAGKYGLRLLRLNGFYGLSREPGVLRKGGNGGYQSLNLAFQLGAARILLLGFDMQRVDGARHWFGDHPEPAMNAEPHWERWAQAFDTTLEFLDGVEVINCSPTSAIGCYPRMTVEQARSLPRREGEVVAACG